MLQTRQTSVGVDDVPRWSLWVVAVVCFAPAAALWLVGVLMAPLWVSMIVVLLAQPERFAVNGPEALWSCVAALAYVGGGFVGILGLLRVLTLPRHERPKRHRVFTIGMVAVGIAALLGVSFPMELADLPDRGDSIAFLVLVLLPLIGAAWLLLKSWRFLLAAPESCRYPQR